MATRAATVQYICDQVGLKRRLESKKMFGEYALYVDGKVVALVCDDQLFLKPTPEGRALLARVREAPPYPGAKNYYALADELEDADRLRELLEVTARVLPAPKPKAKRRPAAKRAPSKAAPRKPSASRTIAKPKRTTLDS